ncbi:MAG: hypothetical protein ACKO96_24535 [Flammeovirgaceae bacterium]
MCHFITGLIDKQTTLDDLNKVGHDNAITFDKCDNAFVRVQLKTNEDYIVKRAKFCDCGTHLGLATRTKSPDNSRVEKREVDKLKKKGWSETKISRWLTDREKTIEKDKARYDRIVNGVDIDIENWINYLNQVFKETKIQHIGLLLHWYKGGLESERIKVKDRIRIRINDLTGDTLLKMDEDVIYEVWR